MKFRAHTDDLLKQGWTFNKGYRGEYIELEGEPVDTIKIVPSGRIDYCSDCNREHGYDCPLDSVEEKCEHGKEPVFGQTYYYRKNGEWILGIWSCTEYDRDRLKEAGWKTELPKSVFLIEEQPIEKMTIERAFQEIHDKLNEVIKRVNSIR